MTLFINSLVVGVYTVLRGIGVTSDSSLGLGDGNAGLDFSGHDGEGFLNVFAVLGRGLEESDIVVLGQFLALLSGNLAGVFHV